MSDSTMDRGGAYRAAIERWEGEGGSAFTLEELVGAPTHELPGSEWKTEPRLVPIGRRTNP